MIKIPTNLFVIGDSLSDVGTLVGGGSQFVQQIPMPGFPKTITLNAPYYQNRSFSDGPVAAEILAKKLNITSVPGWKFSLEGLLNTSIEGFKLGTNYACGGARIMNDSGFKRILLGNFKLSQQIEALLYSHQIQNTDLIYFNIGSNDFIGMIEENKINLSSYVEEQISKMMVEIEDGLKRLVNNNAKNIIVSNLADLGITPAYQGTNFQGFITRAIQKFNTRLSSLIKNLKVEFPDIFKLHQLFESSEKLRQEFLDQGPNYKMSNATKSTMDDLMTTGQITPVLLSNDDIKTYFFFDEVHPGSFVHEKVANELYKIALE